MKSNVKFIVSLLINVILLSVILAECWQLECERIQAYYYQDFTRFLTMYIVKNIEGGHTDHVLAVLKEMPMHPDYGELVSAAEKLNPDHERYLERSPLPR